jgi:hypothetical protein
MGNSIYSPAISFKKEGRTLFMFLNRGQIGLPWAGSTST